MLLVGIPPCADHAVLGIDAVAACEYLFRADSTLSSRDLPSATEGAQDAADDAAADIKGTAAGVKAQAEAPLRGLGVLRNSLATVADQSTDVCGLAGDYNGPAGAIQQDKATCG